MLERVDATKSLTPGAYKKAMGEAQGRLHDLGLELYRKRVPVLLMFEGWDAAGKGGTIKRVAESLDPRGYTVSAFAAPQGDQKTHHYLWRFWTVLPRAGHIAIFDRTYYGRVLVERVENFISKEQWERSYREINDLEAQQRSFGMVICKFWLHITPKEQLRRFKARECDPYRSYKLTDEDWRNRAKYKQYLAAVEEMLERTSTAVAPWTVVEANNKLYARVKVLKTVVGAIEAGLK